MQSLGHPVVGDTLYGAPRIIPDLDRRPHPRPQLPPRRPSLLHSSADRQTPGSRSPSSLSNLSRFCKQSARIRPQLGRIIRVTAPNRINQVPSLKLPGLSFPLLLLPLAAAPLQARPSRPKGPTGYIASSPRPVTQPPPRPPSTSPRPRPAPHPTRSPAPPASATPTSAPHGPRSHSQPAAPTAQPPAKLPPRPANPHQTPHRSTSPSPPSRSRSTK